MSTDKFESPWKLRVTRWVLWIDDTPCWVVWVGPVALRAFDTFKEALDHAQYLARGCDS